MSEKDQEKPVSNPTLEELLVPDVYFKGVPAGQGARSAYSRKRVDEIIDFVTNQPPSKE